MRLGALGVIAAVLFTGMLAIGGQASADDSVSGPSPETICGDREQMVTALFSEYREESKAVGQVDQNAILEIFVSNEGTWTVLATGTDGLSCLVASGDGWEDIPPLAPKVAGVEH